MRKALVSVMAAAMALGFAGTAIAQPPPPTQSAVVNITPMPGATERSRVVLTATTDPIGYTAIGNGTGFDEVSQYITLAYGVNSVPRPVNGIPACADDGTLGDRNTSTARMFMGAWLPVVGGDRTLVGGNTTVNLDQLNTASMRRAEMAGLPAPGDIRPQVFDLRACGLIAQRVR